MPISSEAMASEVEQRPTLVTAGYNGRRRRQWVNFVCIIRGQPLTVTSLRVCLQQIYNLTFTLASSTATNKSLFKLRLIQR